MRLSVGPYAIGISHSGLVESAPRVALADRTEYGVWIDNDSHAHRVRASLLIDGVDVGSFVLPPRGGGIIERPAATGQAKCFRFDRVGGDNAARAGVVSGTPNDRLVEVQFVPEVVPSSGGRGERGLSSRFGGGSSNPPPEPGFSFGGTPARPPAVFGPSFAPAVGGSSFPAAPAPSPGSGSSFGGAPPKPAAVPGFSFGGGAGAGGARSSAQRPAVSPDHVCMATASAAEGATTLGAPSAQHFTPCANFQPDESRVVILRIRIAIGLRDPVTPLSAAAAAVH